MSQKFLTRNELYKLVQESIQETYDKLPRTDQAWIDECTSQIQSGVKAQFQFKQAYYNGQQTPVMFGPMQARELLAKLGVFLNRKLSAANEPK